MKTTHALQSREIAEVQTVAMLACDLHDGPCQTLVAAYHHLQVYRLLQRTSPEEASKNFDQAMNRLHRGIGELRTLLRGLKPLYIEGKSLPDAIRDLIRDHLREDGLRATFSCTPEKLDVPPAQRTAVFCIVQEGLANVQRHSGSKVARVAITQIHSSLQIEIEDWGCGFDPSTVRSDCFGIAGMQARAAALQGHVCITSQLGEGAIVLAYIPIPQGKEQ